MACQEMDKQGAARSWVIPMHLPNGGQRDCPLMVTYLSGL